MTGSTTIRDDAEVFWRVSITERGVTELEGVPGEWRLFAVEQA